MRWIRIQGAAVVVMLATIQQVRHTVFNGTQVANLQSDTMCTIVILAPQRLVSDVDVFV
jgi:hypothetical protein